MARQKNILIKNYIQQVIHKTVVIVFKKYIHIYSRVYYRIIRRTLNIFSLILFTL